MTVNLTLTFASDSVYHDSEFDFNLYFDFALSPSRRIRLKIFCTLHINVNADIMPLVNYFDLNVFAFDCTVSETASGRSNFYLQSNSCLEMV